MMNISPELITPLPVAEPVSGVLRVPLAPMRKMVGRVLLASKQTIPHFYAKEVAEASLLCELHQQEKPRSSSTLNDLLVMACARTLMKFPAFRSRIEGEEMVTFPSANIGIAVGLPDGIAVPVIQGVERMTLAEVALQSRRIVEKARAGKVEGLGKGVFTISNLGMFGIPEFSAIINPPEAAILAVGAVRDAAIVCDGNLRAGKTLTLTLSVDHRVIDGMLAAQFLAELRRLIEQRPSK